MENLAAVMVVFAFCWVKLIPDLIERFTNEIDFEQRWDITLNRPMANHLLVLLLLVLSVVVWILSNEFIREQVVNEHPINFGVQIFSLAEVLTFATNFLAVSMFWGMAAFRTRQFAKRASVVLIKNRLLQLSAEITEISCVSAVFTVASGSASLSFLLFG